MTTLAIDIGGTKFSIAAFHNNQILQRHSQPTHREGGRDWMLHQISTLAKSWHATHHFQNCGIGFGGPVIFPAQKVALSTHTGGWSDFPLAAHISNLLGIPTVMDNDANAGALGEATHGAGAGCDPLFYMTLSTGIGGGLIFHGRIHRGADSYAGEIGHITIDPRGPGCLCGARGCLERLCCGLWLERDHGRPASQLMQEPAFVKTYVVPLAQGLKACIMLCNPARIVIGGGISKAGDNLFIPLRAELARQITSWSRATIDVQPAALGDDSVLYGAMELARQ